MRYEEKKSKAGKVIGYVVGSVAVCVAACIIIPEVMPYVSGAINKKAARSSNRKRLNDDWGPELVKKNQDREEE